MTPDPSRDDEFYVGYLGAPPPGIARRTRRLVALLLAVTLLVALGAQAAFDRAEDKVFEFGEPRRFEGWISESPYPTLLVERPGDAGRLPGASVYYLVGYGKLGAADAVAGLDGRRVELRGTLIYRQDQTMIELEDGSVTPLAQSDPAAPAPPTEDLGILTLQGEIVDSKCYLGVMTPGATKPHRACAARCISGGVPPVLLVRDGEGRAVYLFLTGSDGRTVNREVLSLVAEPVEITGRVQRQGDLLVLAAEPETYRRLK